MAIIKVKKATTINDEVTEEPLTWKGDLFQMLKEVEITPQKSELNRLANTPKTDTVTETEKPWYGFGIKDMINTYQDKVGVTNGTNPFIGIAKTANIPLQGAMLASGMPSTQMLKSLGSIPGAITTGLGLGAGLLTSKVTGGIGNTLLGEAGKNIGEVVPIIGGLTNSFNKNPILNINRFKYYKNIPIRQNNYYRVVNNDAIIDAHTSGVIRQKNAPTPDRILDIRKRMLNGEQVSEKELREQRLYIGTRSGGVPYFSKENLYIKDTKGQNVIVGNDELTNFRKIGPKGRKNQYNENSTIEKGNSATPFENGKFINADAKNFTYFDKEGPLWREKTFDDNNGVINKNSYIYKLFKKKK